VLWCQGVQNIELSNRKLKVHRMIIMHARPRQIETDEHRGNLTNASRANKRILIDLHEANCRLYLLTDLLTCTVKLLLHRSVGRLFHTWCFSRLVPEGKFAPCKFGVKI